MPGRLRTASRPSRTWIAEASYSTPLGGSGNAAAGTDSGTDGSGVSSLTRTSSSGSGRPVGHRRSGLTWIGPRADGARGLDVHDSRSGPLSTSPPRGWGDLWTKCGPRRPESAGSEALRGGADGSPYVRGAVRSAFRARAGRPALRRARLSRRCRGDRGRRGRVRGPVLPRRCVGAEHLDHHHRAVPEILVEPAYDGGREQAQLRSPTAVESVRTTSWPSAKDSALAVRADLGRRRARPSARTSRRP